ncbi:RHS repeat-associated core domain-containing protein [Pseudescherichia sp.]|uniref:RHS repeat-associated core domain-containing protein n=1 Tax=Pseudescherichia sp. TaxID=2055881 RepID=UPI002899BA86|nr:RHS repeat-associated core domain-containing protein [Pseudescherichia sp.]
MSNPIVGTGTPVVSVTDNRGLAVRALNWNREQAGDPLRLLVSHTYVDDASRAAIHRDPRLFAAWTTDSASPANLHTMPSLAGQLLKRESSDSGEQVTLFDAAGRPAWTRDGRGTVQTVAYDELGRPESGCEQLSGSEDIRVSWRSGYGDAGPADDGSRGNNLRGINVAQYNDGGLLQINSVALSGAVLSQTQRFLASAESLPDWPKDGTARETLLEADVYTTTTAVDARGATLSQTDAAGHKLAWRNDVSGHVCYQDVTPAGGETQTLLAGITWSAAGQVLAEAAGNGVTTTYGYDPQNQWLATMTAQRVDNTTLQALSYGYDFTGNVTSMSDGSVASRYYRNQATSGARLFTYDALYQLLSATGRENATNTGMQYSGLPAVMSPDGSQYVNYTRSYVYDNSGNLSTLKHTGAGSFTRTMTTETTSNRSVQQNDGGAQTPDEVKNWFDSNGNLLTLQASAAGTDGLAWDGSNNLRSVTLVSRSSGDSDREIYQYSGSQRVRKQTRTLVNGSSELWNIDEVRYLPGLELRKSWQETAGSSASPSLSEELHVLSGKAGRAGIRVLHWETGKPDGIGNNQVRWGLDDNIGSLSLELDSEGQVISREEYYPFGGTAVWAARNEVEAEYKTVRYSGKERDGTGLYYYGHRYYASWLCRWVSADPAGEVDGLNLFRMVRNNPVSLYDPDGNKPVFACFGQGQAKKEMFAQSIEQESTKYPIIDIPKKIHMIWIGTNKMNSTNVDLSKETASKNEDYDVALYFDSGIQGYEPALEFLQDAFKTDKINLRDIRQHAHYAEMKEHPAFQYYEEAVAAKRYAQASDILRLLLLKYEGGVYKDVDDTQQQPFAQLSAPGGVMVNEEYAASADKAQAIPNTPIAASANNPVIDRTLELAVENYKAGETNILKLAGPDVFTQAMYEAFSGLNIRELNETINRLVEQKKKMLGSKVKKLDPQELMLLYKPYKEIKNLNKYVINGSDHSWSKMQGQASGYI